jgi:tetratricopeptide (TPR) repeat protein
MGPVVVLLAWLLHGIFSGAPPILADQPPLPSQGLGSVSATSPLFGFAQSLFEAGEYYRAIGEFQRFLFFQPEHPLASEAQLKIGLGFFCGERWVPAFEIFRQVAQAAPDPSIRPVATLWMAETRAQSGDYPQALRLYQGVMTEYPGTPVAERAAYLIGWSLLRQRQWAQARAVFAEVDAKSFYHPSAQRLAAALNPPPILPQRSPMLARVLSTVLPGAGQIYTGHALDGLIGLGVHGALIAGATGAAMAGLEGAAGVDAFFTWGFYQTQMSNAAASAREFNVQAEERFIGRLAAQERAFLSAHLPPVPCAPSAQAPASQTFSPG